MISILIPTYRRNDSLKKCLESIRSNSRQINEIIVLSPLPESEISAICAKYGARLIDDESRVTGKRVKSLWKILNEGIESATSDLVGWLNDDCTVNEDWDATALSYFTPSVGMVVLKASGINGNPEYEIGPGYYGVPVANYAILRKSSGIRFDEEFSWFYGDADISLMMASLTSFEVVGTEEGLVTHDHLLDGLRAQNETDLRAKNDKNYFDHKWRFKKRSGDHVVNMSFFETISAFSYNLARECYHLILRGFQAWL